MDSCGWGEKQMAMISIVFFTRCIEQIQWSITLSKMTYSHVSCLHNTTSPIFENFPHRTAITSHSTKMLINVPCTFLEPPKQPWVTSKTLNISKVMALVGGEKNWSSPLYASPNALNWFKTNWISQCSIQIEIIYSHLSCLHKTIPSQNRHHITFNVLVCDICLRPSFLNRQKIRSSRNRLHCFTKVSYSQNV